MPEEAKLERTETGVVPADDGWFILNLAEIGWERVEGGGTWCSFEFPVVALPAPRHRCARSLAGRDARLLPRGVESGGLPRPLGRVHRDRRGGGAPHGAVGLPALPTRDGARHDRGRTGPCAIVMVGTRAPDSTINYLVESAAAVHGASVEVATDRPREAYADWPPIESASSPWPLER